MPKLTSESNKLFHLRFPIENPDRAASIARLLEESPLKNIITSMFLSSPKGQDESLILLVALSRFPSGLDAILYSALYRETPYTKEQFQSFAPTEASVTREEEQRLTEFIISSPELTLTQAYEAIFGTSLNSRVLEINSKSLLSNSYLAPLRYHLSTLRYSLPNWRQFDGVNDIQLSEVTIGMAFNRLTIFDLLNKKGQGKVKILRLLQAVHFFNQALNF